MVTRVKSSSVAAVTFHWNAAAIDANYQLVLRHSAAVHPGDGTYRDCVLSRVVRWVCGSLCGHCAVSMAGDYQQFIHSVYV